MLGRQYELPSLKTPGRNFSLPEKKYKGRNSPLSAQKESSTGEDDFHLDPMAHARARATGGKPAGSCLLEKVEERAEEGDVQEAATSYQQEEKGEDSWGDCFAVEWISTRKLPFNRTRHMRNPWNHNREVKVSRDGTELEPTVGQKLLDEWDKLSELQEQEPSTTLEGGSSKLDGPTSKRLMRSRSV